MLLAKSSLGSGRPQLPTRTVPWRMRSLPAPTTLAELRDRCVPRASSMGCRSARAYGPPGYVVLPAANLYKPIWDYDRKTLAKDLSAHLIYGLGTATTVRLLSVAIGPNR